MRHGHWLGQTALAALTAGMLLWGEGSSANAVDGDKPARMKLEVTDGKTCPPPNARTEFRFRVPGSAMAPSPRTAQSQNDTPDSIALLSYCPASVEPRSVIHTGCLLGTEPGETPTLTATMLRAAQPMPIRGKLASPRPAAAIPAAQRATAPLFSAEDGR